MRLVLPQMYATEIISQFHIRPRTVNGAEIMYREACAALIVRFRVMCAVW